MTLSKGPNIHQFPQLNKLGSIGDGVVHYVYKLGRLSNEKSGSYDNYQ